MTNIPAYTYAGGELAPGLYGRVDLTKYMTGVKLAKNFMISVEGGLEKRFGMYFVGKPKFQDKEAKLIPWRIADDDSYMMEFGDFYIRLYRFGGPVLYPTGSFDPDPASDAVNVTGYLEIPTPYPANVVNELKFSFANDIVYINHVEYNPRQLKRLGLFDWSIESSNFNPNEASPDSLSAEWQHFKAGAWQTADMDQPSYDETPQDLTYVISATMEDGMETLGSTKVTVSADLGHPSFRVKLWWAAKAGAKQYTLYKGKSGIFGFIGFVDAADTLEFMDMNYAPSYDVVPIKAFEGFGTAQFPRVSEFYKQRMAYAGTKDEPQVLWFSRPLFFTSMATSIPSQDNDAIKAPLVGNARHTIHHMIQLKKFIIFTDSAEWVIHTTNNEALSAGTIDPIIETSYGSSPNLQPMAIGDRILFVQNISGTIRDMGYEFTTDAYKADDLSRLARHLFENKEIKAWDYAAFPNNLVYTVCDDGTMPMMTYVREHEIWGWSHADTDGLVTDVACVPELNQHASYFQTTRMINGVATKFIERTEVPFTDSIEDMFYVDCGLTYKDERFYSAMTLLDPATVQLTLAAHGQTVGSEIQIENKDFSLRMLITAVTTDTITAQPKYGRKLPAALTVTVGSAFICTNHLTGFDHLASTTGNVVLADGSVYENISIDEDGELNLPIYAARIHCGRPYEGEIFTLDLDDERAAGRYIDRTVSEVTIRLKNSRGVLVGASESSRDLLSIPSRNLEDYDQPNLPLNGVYTVPTHTAWAKTAGVRVLAPYPLPCHVLNIVPDINYGN